MAERAVSFHFDYLSPYSYLAWHRLQRFAPDHGLRIEVRPTLLAALLNYLGHKGPGEIPPKRSYMFKDCLRAAALLGVPFEPPASHPFNPLPSLRATLLDMEESTRQELVSRLFDATWAQSRDVGSPDVVAEICEEVGLPNARERIEDPTVKKRLRDASNEAIELGVFGVPTMIVDGELFWGTDSFIHLERFLAGRDPAQGEDMAQWAAVPATAHRQ
jgi:2-hydroxychromene-2-carboxylate isomerase